MSLKYCQGTECHKHFTKDRLKGTKGNKHYETRRRSNFYYGNGNFCSMRCMHDWLEQYADQAIDHFGRITQPIKYTGENAWVKDYDWRTQNDGGHNHYWLNKITDERIPITLEQFNDRTLIRPNNLSQ